MVPGMKKILALAIVSMLALAACGSDDDPTESALSGVCEAQEQVLADLEELAAADFAETTSEDLEGMLDSLSSSVDELQGAKDDLSDQDIENVTGAFDSLKSDLSEISDVPLAELEDAAVATIDTAIDDFQAAYVQAYENSSCGSGE
jgi:hypothetical protein